MCPVLNILILKFYRIKKQKVSEHYAEYNDWIQTTDFPDKVKNNWLKVLGGVEKFMMSEDYSEEWLEHFVDQTKNLTKYVIKTF